ncbi:G-type lectin S-receptor-like serine/threonine-protein kinase At4g27290 isoform X1 [Coffea arabica]|uniref:Receptor-like serine/threonine-protein kinase n=1 Tax=Coffea arabica TaxID=13443 RepID=A0ABM4WT57_COFAR
MMVILFIIFSIASPFFCQFSSAVDFLAPNQVLLDNGGTLASAGRKFELGFFGPSNVSKRYIGIWFKNIPEQTVVWVANKDNPIPSSSGILSITPSGSIVIINNSTNSIIWASNTSATLVSNPTLQLLDNGNLVLKNGSDYGKNSGTYLWQSFDHPCDTLIPGMKLGWNFRTNQEWYLTSWKSLQDPSTGAYTYRVDPGGLPQVVLSEGSAIQYRSGPWDGVRFGGGDLEENTVFRPEFVFDANNEYYTFENTNDSIVSRFVLNQSGLIQHLTWSIRRNEWVDIATVQSDACDQYALCGSYGICNINNSPYCSCPPGFTPKLPADWQRMDWSGGCVRKNALNCSGPEGFRRFSKLKLPDTANFLVNKIAIDPMQCAAACLRNCSCTAYAKIDGSVCVVWFGDLLDVRTYHYGGQDLYIRMPASELGSDSKRDILIISVSVALGTLVLVLGGWCLLRKWTAKGGQAKEQETASQENTKRIADDEIELPLFDLITISNATNQFSFANKIGEGGFGPVYQGILSTGQQIAVKKDSKDSGQGIEEFKNEVILIAKLQHRNLVRLLGCCIHGDERMLVYEYMPNRSLDLFIFNQGRGKVLDWRKRFDIIVGIARGLLYLHRDSRLRIIHRDLKASNILLDSEINPKISDFGLARTFGCEHYQDNTKRVMGTYGYMAPEYAVDGLFSVKSDVFSFGVLVLEIVSGEKNRGFCHPDHDLNLLGHAWRLWNEGNTSKLVDPFMEGAASTSEVLRCIHVGLLCVQQRPDDRPAMSTVLLLLDSENPTLPQPKQPGFYIERTVIDTDSTSSGKMPHNSTDVTVTLLHGR